jgi:cation diffusion facilitator family transporter
LSNQADSVKSIFYALFANGGIAVAKLGAAFYTGSTSMLAEAIHSLADCGNQGLLLLGLKRAKQPASPDYPLGHGRAIYFWSFIVALILFSMGGLFSIYEGVHKLNSGEPLNAPLLAIAILVFSMVAEAFSLYGCLREVNKARGQRNLWRWFRESRQSELIVVLGEDVAALFGLAFALIAVLVAVVTGNPMYDALGSIMIGVLLILVALGIGLEVKGLLIGQSAEPTEQEAIRQFIASHPRVEQVLNLITVQLGQELMVAVKAKMRESQNASTLIDDINATESALQAAFPAVRWVFFEPDMVD